MAKAKKKPNNRLASEGWKGVHVYAGKVRQPVPHPEKWLSIAEACEAAGVTRKTMHKYIENRTVKSKRHGYYRLISKASIEKLCIPT